MGTRAPYRVRIAISCPGDRSAELQGWRDMPVDIRVTLLKKQGGSFQDLAAAKSTEAHAAKWDHFVIDPPLFCTLV
jgi:hypothetical protein